MVNGDACLCLAWWRHRLIFTTSQTSYLWGLSGDTSGYLDQKSSQNFLNSCLIRYFKVLKYSSEKVYCNDSILDWFHSVLWKLWAFKDHFRAIFVTTTSSRSNGKKIVGCESAIDYCRSRTWEKPSWNFNAVNKIKPTKNFFLVPVMEQWRKWSSTTFQSPRHDTASHEIGLIS